MNEKLIQSVAYELYKQDWIDSHTNKAERLHAMQEYYEELLEDDTFSQSYEEWLYENGFDGMIYADFDEFIECEYKDEAYMKHLLGDELYQWFIIENGKDFPGLE